MHINRFDRGFSRRKFLNDAARGMLGAGVLMPLSQAIAANGEISKAYPDELLSIEGYTKGKIKTGDFIDARQALFAGREDSRRAPVRLVQHAALAVGNGPVLK